MLLNSIGNQFLRFVVVGGSSTVINYAIFYLLYSKFLTHYLIASSLGFFSGVLFGYFFNKNWTFQVIQTSKLAVVEYYGVYLFSLVISLIFLYVTVDWLGIDARLANIFAIAITTTTNFLGTKFLVFKK